MAPETTALKQRRARSHARLKRWAWVLDDAVRLPIVNVRVGVDAIIGLVPVIGDFIGVVLSSVVFVEAVRLRAPRSLLLRMAGNLVADFLLGVTPIVGDILDVAWRANRRNLSALESWLDERPAPASARRWPSATLGLAALAVAGVITWILWRWLMHSV